MARSSRHLVVDGSNIATEGRTVPSLAQLDEAVRAIQAEDPSRQVTVIVDATFAHRIEDSERSEFEDASNNGEILMPPAGAVGRGDAFILQVAEKADAAVLSNDSFQEFHGTHPWLFDEDRLIGGKPVEGVGWVFVARVPVRGPASRRATRDAKKGRSSKKGSKRAAKTSKAAQGPPPVPTSDNPPPKGRRSKAAMKSSKPAGDSSRKSGRSKDQGKGDDGGQDRDAKKKRGRRSSKNLEELNSPIDFLGFVAKHSIGDEVEAVVERFSSHGCYVRVAGAQCYLPSSAMGDPPPNRARDVVALGQDAIVRVESLDSDRRGINVQLVRVVSDGSDATTSSTGRSRRRKQDQTSQQTATVADDSAGEANPTRSDTTVATKKSAKKATKKAAKKAKKVPAKATTSARAAKATARKAAKKATKKRTAKKAAKKTTRKATKKVTKKAATKKAAKKVTKKAATKKAAKKTTRKAAKKVTKKAATKKAAKKVTKKAAKKRPARKAAKKRTARKA